MEKVFGKLAAVTLFYLAVPSLIFAVGWLKPMVGLPMVVLGLFGLLDFGLRTDWRTVDRRKWLVPALTALVAMLLSGVGGFGLQNWDHNKHNAILHDLITHPWPVRYGPAGDDGLVGPLVYYVAWYLPAALVGKAAGWVAANVALFLWGWLGLSLVMAWVQRLVRGRAWAPVAFLFFSGWDVVALLASGKNPLFLSNLQMHHWAGFAQYTHNLAAINWVPHHAIPIWLATGFVIDALARGRREGVLAMWLFLPLWSPWAWVGTAPYVILTLVKGTGVAVDRRILAPGLLAVFSLLFMASNRGQVVKGFAWTFMAPTDFMARYTAFVLLEFGLVAAVLYAVARPQGKERLWFFGTVALLLLLPTYRFGISGDLTMRASMPALFVLAILALRGLEECVGARRLGLAAALMVGALSPLHEFAYSAIHCRMGAPNPDQVRSLPFTDGRQYARQFLGDPSKTFWKGLAK